MQPVIKCVQMHARDQVDVDINDANEELTITVDGKEVLVVTGIKQARMQLNMWKMRNTQTWDEVMAKSPLAGFMRNPRGLPGGYDNSK